MIDAGTRSWRWWYCANIPSTLRPLDNAGCRTERSGDLLEHFNTLIMTWACWRGLWRRPRDRAHGGFLLYIRFWFIDSVSTTLRLFLLSRWPTCAQIPRGVFYYYVYYVWIYFFSLFESRPSPPSRQHLYTSEKYVFLLFPRGYYTSPFIRFWNWRDKTFYVCVWSLAIKYAFDVHFCTDFTCK